MTDTEPKTGIMIKCSDCKLLITDDPDVRQKRAVCVCKFESLDTSNAEGVLTQETGE